MLIVNVYLDIIEFIVIDYYSFVKFKFIKIQKSNVQNRHSVSQKFVKHIHSRQLLIKSAKTITTSEPSFKKLFILGKFLC